MAANKFYLLALSNVEVNASRDLCEIPFLRKAFKQLKEEPFFPDFPFIITDHRTHLPDDKIDSQTIVLYLSNEDGHLPRYIEKTGILFTPYPPKETHPKAFTIPLGYHGAVPSLTPLSMKERSLDLFFSGRKIHRRKAFFDQVDKIQQTSSWELDIRKTNAFAEGMKPPHYAAMLNKTKIVPAPEGNYSNITFRLFEGLRQGSIPVTPPLPETWYFKEFPGYQLNKWEELSPLLSTLLPKPEKLSALQSRILSYYRDYCSEEALARYIRQVIKSHFSL